MLHVLVNTDIRSDEKSTCDLYGQHISVPIVVVVEFPVFSLHQKVNSDKRRLIRHYSHCDRHFTVPMGQNIGLYI